MSEPRTPQQKIPGCATIRLTYKGETWEARVRCRREPLTEEDKARGCQLAIRQNMTDTRGQRRRAKSYRAEFVCFSPDRIYQPPVEGPHEFQGVVLQEHPVIIAKIKPFLADTAKEAWEEAVRRVLASYKPGDVRLDRLYGTVTATGNPDDTYFVERKILTMSQLAG